jgi:hypothetical protein
MYITTDRMNGGRRSGTPLAVPRIRWCHESVGRRGAGSRRSMSGPRGGYAGVPETGIAADAVNTPLEVGPQVQNLLVMIEACAPAR